jgi:hypothetical protein
LGGVGPATTGGGTTIGRFFQIGFVPDGGGTTTGCTMSARLFACLGFRVEYAIAIH